MKTKLAIVGGGVAGLTAAIGLQKLGIDVKVYERVHTLKGIGAGFGLAANAMHAFDLLGLREGVENIGHFLPSYNILDQQGKVLVAPDTRTLSEAYQQRNFAIHRGDLHQFLLEQLPAETLVLGKEASRLEQDSQGVRIYFTDGDLIEADGLIVADGVKSKLRQQLVPSSVPRYAGYTCWRAIIDNTASALTGSTETWGDKGRFGMTPLVGNKLYWYACINAPANSTTYANFQVADLQKQFASYHAPIATVLENTADTQLLWNDIIDIKPLDSLAYGRVLLMGDAGHATTPNLGQGACQAIEDVAVLIDQLQETTAIDRAFERVSQRRLKRTRYITNTSWQIGKISQWNHPLLINFRNLAMRVLPEQLKQMQLRKLLQEDFMSINKI